jgi:hypothetical protein
LATRYLIDFIAGVSDVSSGLAPLDSDPGVDALLGFLPQGRTPLGLTATPDARVLLFNFGVALVTGLLFGLVPALQATKPDVAFSLSSQTLR